MKGDGKENEHSVLVSGVPPRTSVDDLRNLFESQGFTNITDVYLPSGKQFGFVRFNNLTDAENAASLDRQLDLFGTTLNLEVSYGNKRRSEDLARERGPKGGKGCKGGMFWGPAPEALRPAKKSGEFSIWCGNLPSNATADDLRAGFESCGVDSMTDVYLPPGKAFGFVRFATAEAQDEAMARVSGLQLNGTELEFQASEGVPRQSKAHVSSQPQQTYHLPFAAHGWGGGYVEQYSKGPARREKPPDRGEFSIWVGNLTSSATPEAVREAFEFVGVENMTDVWLPPGKAFGFVRFATQQDADQAMSILERQGVELHGTQLTFQPSDGEKRHKRAPDSVPQSYGPVLAAHGWDSWGSGYAGQFGPGAGYHEQIFPSAGLKGSPADSKKPTEFSVWVGNLTNSVSSAELRAAFESRGVDTMTDVYIPHGKGFGFVRFATREEVEQAIPSVAGLNLHGADLEFKASFTEKRRQEPVAEPVMLYGGGRGPAVAFHYDDGSYQNASAQRAGEVSVKISNLPVDATPDEVVEAFSEQGVDSMTDCYIPTGKRFGFVRFSSAAEGQHAMQQSVYIRDGILLALELAAGKKRRPQEMQAAEEFARARTPPFREAPRFAIENPDVSLDTPSVKVSGLPPGIGSDQLHKALVSAGCTGNITDVYIPKGDRGFGFVRFSRQADAERLTRLQVRVHGTQVGLEMAVNERKGKREAFAAPANDLGMYGPGMAAIGGWGPPASFVKGGWGPMPGKGFWAGGKVGPYGGKGW